MWEDGNSFCGHAEVTDNPLAVILSQSIQDIPVEHPDSAMSQQTWLLTGCSSGFGSSFATEILARGDHVIATARSLVSLEHLIEAGASCLQLDVTASQAELNSKIGMVEAMYGPVDILVNNAGYAEVGILEDVR